MKLSIKTVGMMMLAVTTATTAVSCKKKGCMDQNATNFDSEAEKDDNSCVYDSNQGGNVVKTGIITSNETWTADNVYELDGRVVVDNGATLTIEAGTIIKGQEGTGTLASALIVARGSKLNAVGSASAPIIFTSVLDNIQPGELTGSNLTETDQGLWGGVIVLGYAPLSAEDGDTESQIEGIPTSESYGAYGGNDAADNSGTISYVSIRHGGALIGAGNEINGLTLGAVGTGTTISNVEVTSNLDDGIEFFGGTVNATNTLTTFCGDDALDIDQNYSGTVDNFIVINGANSDKGLEIDGPEGSTYTDGLFTLNNGSVYAADASDVSCDFKSKAQGNINNVSFGAALIRASYQNNCMDSKTDAFTHLTSSSKLVFNSSAFNTVTVYTKSEDDLENSCYNGDAAPGDQAAAESAMTSSSSTGANNVFGWTWTSVNGKM